MWQLCASVRTRRMSTCSVFIIIITDEQREPVRVRVEFYSFWLAFLPVPLHRRPRIKWFAAYPSHPSSADSQTLLLESWWK